MLAHDKTGANTIAKAAKPIIIVVLRAFISLPPLLGMHPQHPLWEYSITISLSSQVFIYTQCCGSVVKQSAAVLLSNNVLPLQKGTAVPMSCCPAALLWCRFAVLLWCWGAVY
jgi:hypothetical protein